MNKTIYLNLIEEEVQMCGGTTIGKNNPMKICMASDKKVIKLSLTKAQAEDLKNVISCLEDQ